MDPLKSLVKKKRLFSSFLQYGLLNRAAAEANLYSEEQGRELEELAQDNPVAAVERLFELIRVQSTYEAFISTLERSIEIGLSQQRTVVDAQAHQQLINEIVGEKKPKGFIDKIRGPFKAKEKKSEESESKKHSPAKDKDSLFNYGAQTIPMDSFTLMDFRDFSTPPDTIYEQLQDSRDRVSSMRGSDPKRRSLPRRQYVGKNQGSHPGVSYSANKQSVLMNKESSTINVTNIDAGTQLQRVSSTTSLDFAMGGTSVRIENVQRDIESLKMEIKSLTDKVSQVNVVATNVEHIQKDQDVNRADRDKLSKIVVTMGERLTALEASGNKEEVIRKEELTGLQAKYQELERENEKIKGREVELQAKVQSYEKRQQELQKEETTTQSYVKELHDKMQVSDAKHQKSWEEIEELKHTNVLLLSDAKVAQNTLAQFDSLLKGMKEEIGQISRQSATMQAEMSSREEDKYVSQEKRLLTDEQKREIDDLERRLEKQIAQSQERIEQMGKRQKAMDGEIQDNIQTIGQIHLKLRSNKGVPPEWDKLQKKLEDAGREMGKISEITEKLKTLEELNKTTIQDMNDLRGQVGELKDALENLFQKDQDKKKAEVDQATGLENLKQQVTHMQTFWEKRFEEFERKVHIDAEWIKTMNEELQREEEKLMAMMDERYEALKRKQALQRKHPTPYYSTESDS